MDFDNLSDGDEDFFDSVQAEGSIQDDETEMISDDEIGDVISPEPLEELETLNTAGKEKEDSQLEESRVPDPPQVFKLDDNLKETNDVENITEGFSLQSELPVEKTNTEQTGEMLENNDACVKAEGSCNSTGALPEWSDTIKDTEQVEETISAPEHLCLKSQVQKDPVMTEILESEAEKPVESHTVENSTETSDCSKDSCEPSDAPSQPADLRNRAGELLSPECIAVDTSLDEGLSLSIQHSEPEGECAIIVLSGSTATIESNTPEGDLDCWSETNSTLDRSCSIPVDVARTVMPNQSPKIELEEVAVRSSEDVLVKQDMSFETNFAEALSPISDNEDMGPIEATSDIVACEPKMDLQPPDVVEENRLSSIEGHPSLPSAVVQNHLYSDSTEKSSEVESEACPVNDSKAQSIHSPISDHSQDDMDLLNSPGHQGETTTDTAVSSSEHTELKPSSKPEDSSVSQIESSQSGVATETQSLNEKQESCDTTSSVESSNQLLADTRPLGPASEKLIEVSVDSLLNTADALKGKTEGINCETMEPFVATDLLSDKDSVNGALLKMKAVEKESPTEKLRNAEKLDCSELDDNFDDFEDLEPNLVANVDKPSVDTVNGKKEQLEGMKEDKLIEKLTMVNNSDDSDFGDDFDNFEVLDELNDFPEEEGDFILLDELAEEVEDIETEENRTEINKRRTLEILENSHSQDEATFEGLGLTAEGQDSMARAGFAKPTRFQASVLRSCLKGTDVVVIPTQASLLQVDSILAAFLLRSVDGSLKKPQCIVIGWAEELLTGATRNLRRNVGYSLTTTMTKRTYLPEINSQVIFGTIFNFWRVGMTLSEKLNLENVKTVIMYEPLVTYGDQKMPTLHTAMESVLDFITGDAQVQQWIAISSQGQGVLEKLFCDNGRSPVVIVDKTPGKEVAYPESTTIVPKKVMPATSTIQAEEVVEIDDDGLFDQLSLSGDEQCELETLDKPSKSEPKPIDIELSPERPANLPTTFENKRRSIDGTEGKLAPSGAKEKPKASTDGKPTTKQKEEIQSSAWTGNRVVQPVRIVREDSDRPKSKESGERIVGNHDLDVSRDHRRSEYKTEELSRRNIAPVRLQESRELKSRSHRFAASFQDQSKDHRGDRDVIGSKRPSPSRARPSERDNERAVRERSRDRALKTSPRRDPARGFRKHSPPSRDSRRSSPTSKELRKLISPPRRSARDSPPRRGERGHNSRTSDSRRGERQKSVSPLRRAGSSPKRSRSPVRESRSSASRRHSPDRKRITPRRESPVRSKQSDRRRDRASRSAEKVPIQVLTRDRSDNRPYNRPPPAKEDNLVPLVGNVPPPTTFPNVGGTLPLYNPYAAPPPVTSMAAQEFGVNHFASQPQMNFVNGFMPTFVPSISHPPYDPSVFVMSGLQPAYDTSSFLPSFMPTVSQSMNYGQNPTQSVLTSSFGSSFTSNSSLVPDYSANPKESAVASSVGSQPVPVKPKVPDDSRKQEYVDRKSEDSSRKRQETSEDQKQSDDNGETKRARRVSPHRETVAIVKPSLRTMKSEGSGTKAGAKGALIQVGLMPQTRQRIMEPVLAKMQEEAKRRPEKLLQSLRLDIHVHTCLAGYVKKCPFNPEPFMDFLIPCLEGEDVIAEVKPSMHTVSAVCTALTHVLDPRCLDFQVLVIAPTSILVDQFHHQISEFVRWINLTAHASSDYVPYDSEVSALTLGVRKQIIVGTPLRILRLMKKNLLGNSIRFVTLYNLDDMMDSSKSSQIEECLKLISTERQIVATAGIVNEDISSFLQKKTRMAPQVVKLRTAPTIRVSGIPQLLTTIPTYCLNLPTWQNNLAKLVQRFERKRIVVVCEPDFGSLYSEALRTKGVKHLFAQTREMFLESAEAFSSYSTSCVLTSIYVNTFGKMKPDLVINEGVKDATDYYHRLEAFSHGQKVTFINLAESSDLNIYKNIEETLKYQFSVVASINDITVA